MRVEIYDMMFMVKINEFSKIISNSHLMNTLNL